MIEQEKLDRVYRWCIHSPGGCNSTTNWVGSPTESILSAWARGQNQGLIGLIPLEGCEAESIPGSPLISGGFLAVKEAPWLLESGELPWWLRW